MGTVHVEPGIVYYPCVVVALAIQLNNTRQLSLIATTSNTVAELLPKWVIHTYLKGGASHNVPLFN